MVELEPVPAEEEVERAHLSPRPAISNAHGRVEILDDMTRFDAERLHLLDHAPRALHRLARAPRRSSPTWDDYLPKFRKVMPLEYRRALAEMEKARRCNRRRSRVLRGGEGAAKPDGQCVTGCHR